MDMQVTMLVSFLAYIEEECAAEAITEQERDDKAKKAVLDYMLAKRWNKG